MHNFRNIIAVVVVAVWFNVLTLVSSQICNYIRSDDIEVGYAQPINVCIGDKSNKASIKYICSNTGDQVTKLWFNSSYTCDNSTFFESTVYTTSSTSTNTEFECNGNNDCDICIRTYGTGCDINGANADSWSEDCWINEICQYIFPSGMSTQSGKYKCISKTHWKSTEWDGTTACDGSGSSRTFSAGCQTNTINSDIYYEIKSIPCENESHAAWLQFLPFFAVFFTFFMW
eukprot:UN06654